MAGQLYFPPTTAGATWDTINPAQMGWCTSELDTLDAFLEDRNTKSFIVLHKGKIALEWYYDGFGQDSLWYWASAAKTLKAFMIGQLQEDALVDINDRSSDYLGLGWSACPPTKEALITVKDQLQMTTGLDYTVPNLNCTLDTCLQYRSDAGTQWYYHNAPYRLLTEVIEQASGQSLNLYTFQNIARPTGMQGFWLDTLYISNARSMARFGLLNLAKGVWDGTSLLGDSVYLNAMKTPSQSLNPAYGYLWWLNGQSSYIQPGLPNSFSGSIVPSAPTDMYMAAGKNDQRVYVVPSMDLVVVRQGNAADQSLLALSNFDTELWNLLNQLICQQIGLSEPVNTLSSFTVYPNPAQHQLLISGLKGEALKIYNTSGLLVYSKKVTNTVDVSKLEAGVYYISDGYTYQCFVKE
jgi:CubicO group peptidase (beta-lactamase class C family)